MTKALDREVLVVGLGPVDPTDTDLLRIGIGDDRIAPFREAVAFWLMARHVEAVLVRPDRIIFGAGPSEDLLDAWANARRRPVAEAAA